MRFLALQSRFVVTATLAINGAHAQATDNSYPSKPIRMIVPLTPSSATDIIARIVGPKLADRWEKQVVIDNRPSAVKAE